MKKFDYVVFIGRFQPFHNGHLEVCKQALKYGNKLIIITGSGNSSPSIRNPFTAFQRQQMITNALSENHFDPDTYVIDKVRDYFYSEDAWRMDVQRTVNDLTQGLEPKIAIVGHKKDFTSSYLNWFPNWELIEVETNIVLNATQIRKDYFEGKEITTETCSRLTILWLNATKELYYYRNLKEEYDAMKFYKEQWAFAPYPPIFVTTDAVVTCGGNILLVKRKAHPGKGLLALPGGFINPEETLLECCLRELKEETKIKVPKPVLKGSIQGKAVFDHPLRSVRGRTISHAFYIPLMDTILPKVKGGDDANGAFWVPLEDLEMENMFEDHGIIIESFIGRGLV